MRMNIAYRTDYAHKSTRESKYGRASKPMPMPTASQAKKSRITGGEKETETGAFPAALYWHPRRSLSVLEASRTEKRSCNSSYCGPRPPPLLADCTSPCLPLAVHRRGNAGSVRAAGLPVFVNVCGAGPVGPDYLSVIERALFFFPFLPRFIVP